MRSGARSDEVLDLLRRHGDADASTVAGRLRIHPTTARFHLESLVSDGRVERAEAVPSGSRGRPRQRYRATAPTADEPGYRTLAAILAASIGNGQRGARRAREAGRSWANSLDRTEARPSTRSRRTRTDALMAHLERLGFAPRRSRGRLTGSTRIEMWSCPYLEVARERPDVTCGVHRGLVEGLLARDGIEADVDLVPFATADYCTVTLRATAPPRKALT